jgi:Protein of unknown function (DUF4232)
MKTAHQTAAATTTVLTALILAGCQQGGSASGAASPAHATHSGPATAVSSSASASASGLAGAAAGPARCHTPGLAVTLGAPQGPAGGQQTMSLTFTNTSAAACSMYGFPGVNLLAGSIQWALVRQSHPPQRIVLPPGGHARSTLTLLRWESGGGTSFAPTRVYVTPPDETTYRTLAWPHGVVLVRQDEATHPGTFIGPVG